MCVERVGRRVKSLYGRRRNRIGAVKICWERKMPTARTEMGPGMGRNISEGGPEVVRAEVGRGGGDAGSASIGPPL